MFRFIGYAGPWAIPLTALTLVVAGLIARALLARRSTTGDAPSSADRLPGAILFWGFVSAALGFLGQCAALYQITRTVVTAPALSPAVVAEGFASSFVPTLWGGGLLLMAGLAWLTLRRGAPIRGSLSVLVAVGVVGVAAVEGCTKPAPPAAADLTRDVWQGDAGGDQFLFDLRGTAPDSLRGVVHVMHDGKMTSEVSITGASYHAPDLEMHTATGATYRGKVDVAQRRVRGGLSFGGAAGPDMDLQWADPSGIPGFRARSDTGAYHWTRPTDDSDGWEAATPEEVGLERAAVDSLVSAVARGDAGLIHSLILVRHGKLVVDEYFHGYGPADLHRLASTTKSVDALLVGAALDRGLIPSLDTPLSSFFPDAVQASDTAWSKETLHHVLSMSMGLDWTPAEADSVHGTGEAFFRRVLARKVVDAPGTRWAYVNANVNLLAGVIHAATGMHAEAFAREALFGPLDIRTWDWSYGRVNGYDLMDGSLQLRPRDLAKIGTMVAQGGRWQGRQVIGRRWIEEFTKEHLRTGTPTLSGYGDLWWLGEMPTPQGNQRMIVANGWGSQFIVVFPRLDMVVVTTGGNDDNGRHFDLGQVLARYLPPAT